MAYTQGRWEGMKRTRGTRRTPGMSSPKHDRDSDRESLTDWTLVDREGTPDKTTRVGAEKDDKKESGESDPTPAKEESKKESGKEKKGSGGTEEEDGEELPEDLISMGKRVQEIKDEGDVESLASSDVMVLDPETKAAADEETDLSLASSPSLPDDLPAIKPDTQYRHTPDRELNSRLNVVVALTLACVLGLGLGHFLGFVALSGFETSKGWSSRSLWQENLNSAQVIEALTLENEQLKSEITRLQHENMSPIKISGKDGKNARDLRERITHLLEDNEELRVAVMKQQFAGLPEGDDEAFNDALGANSKLRLSVGKLTHLGPDLTALKVSANDLQKENQDLQKQVGKLRYQEQPLPQELNVVAREVENLKRVVDEASKKKKPPPNYENAKMYLTFMSQVLQALHDFKEGGFVEKLDVATDVFEGLVPGNVKPSASIQQKLSAVRSKFVQLKSSLATKWEKIKELSRPQHLTKVSQDTLSKMNRVIVNVVNKMKDIGQANIMKRGKASLENTATTLAQSLAALGNQFDQTWKNLEAEVKTDGKEETAVDAGEGETKGTAPKDVKDGASDSKTGVPNKSKKVVGKSGGSGGGGKGGGRGGGKDGGDDKGDPEEKESTKVKAEKKTEEKPDARRDRSRRSRSTDKKEKKEEKKEKKAKGKEEKAKKKDKEAKKSKKDKDNTNEKTKSKDKDASTDKKEGEWSKKSLHKEDKRYYKGLYNKYDKKQRHFDDEDEDEDDTDTIDSDAGNKPEAKQTKTLHKKKQTYKDDDDEDDDDYDDKLKRKYQQKVIQKDEDDDDSTDDEDKKKGLLRHWEKPSRKNYRREYPGPKKAFIRRRDN